MLIKALESQTATAIGNCWARAMGHIRNLDLIGCEKPGTPTRDRGVRVVHVGTAGLKRPIMHKRFRKQLAFIVSRVVHVYVIVVTPVSVFPNLWL